MRRWAYVWGFAWVIMVPNWAVGASCDAALGQWSWFTGGTVTIESNKVLRYDGTPLGTWECKDPQSQTLALHWNPTGLTDIVRISADGLSISGQNNVGTTVSGKRRSVSSAQPVVRETPAQATSVVSAQAEQLFQLGSRYAAQHRDPEAAAEFLKCADMGHPRCESAIGLMYDQGRGVPKDMVKAVYYVTRAAAGGNRGAQYQIGVWFEDGDIFTRDAASAWSWYMKSAQQGMPQAERRVGLAYEIGDLVEHNRDQAIAWLMKAAAQGDGISGEIARLLKSPNTPARFKDEDALAAYYQSVRAAQYPRSRTNDWNRICGASCAQRKDWEAAHQRALEFKRANSIP